MELRLPHMVHLFNIFHENKDSDNFAKVLEEECIKMFGTKSSNDEHDCNVVAWTNDDCIVLMTIALVMIKMSLISMSTFVECIEFASTHQIGKIDFARGISI